MRTFKRAAPIALCDWCCVVICPCLQASVEGLPDCLLEGELRKCTLVLRNTGASALHGIRVVTSGPDVYLPPDNADLSSPSVDSVMPGKGPLLQMNPSILASLCMLCSSSLCAANLGAVGELPQAYSPKTAVSGRCLAVCWGKHAAHVAEAAEQHMPSPMLPVPHAACRIDLQAM